MGAYTWVATSVVIPVGGASAASQLLTAASKASNLQQILLTIAGWTCLGAAVIVAVIAKIFEYRRGSTIAAARRRQLSRLRDELMPFASTTADMVINRGERPRPFVTGTSAGTRR